MTDQRGRGARRAEEFEKLISDEDWAQHEEDLNDPAIQAEMKQRYKREVLKQPEQTAAPPLSIPDAPNMKNKRSDWALLAGGNFTMVSHHFRRWKRIYPDIPRSFWDFLDYVWEHTVGSKYGENGCFVSNRHGPIKNQLLAGRWMGALWGSGVAEVEFAKWEDSDGTKVKLRQDANEADWMLFLSRLEVCLAMNGGAGNPKLKRPTWRRWFARDMKFHGAKLPPAVLVALNKPEPLPRKKGEGK